MADSWNRYQKGVDMTNDALMLMFFGLPIVVGCCAWVWEYGLHVCKARHEALSEFVRDEGKP